MKYHQLLKENHSARSSKNVCTRFFRSIEFKRRQAVADLEGVQGVRSNPPPDPNYLIFMGNLREFV